MGLIAYAVLVASAFTPLYEDLGIDAETAVEAAVIAAAQVGVSIAVGRAWVFALAPIPPLIAFFAGGAEGLVVLLLIFGIPAMLILTAFGWALGHWLKDERVVRALAVTFFVLPALAALWAAIVTIDYSRRDHLPASVQRQLPVRVFLADLCEDPGLTAEERRESALSPSQRRDIERRAEVLLRELDEHPDSLVTYTYEFSDEPDEVRDITVRQLAKEQLAEFEDVGEDFEDFDADKCQPELQEQLRQAAD